MNRRTLLRRTAPLASLAGLAGCLASTNPEGARRRTVRGTADGSGKSTTDSDETTTDADETTGDSTSEDAGDFSGVDSDADEPFQSLSVGSREDVAFPDNNRPHSVRVWNAAERPREITVRVFRDAKELLDRSVEFDADAYLEVALNEPGDYRVAVGLADGEPTTFRVRRALFDCNASATDVGVAPDGRVETSTFSTLMGCPGPEIADTSLSVGEGECGTEHSASVTYDDEQVRVEGTVRTPDPGYDLELADASYDAEPDELRVEIRATEGDSSPGVQCVGEVSYEATVDFEHDLPGEVVVIHDTSNGTEEVARQKR